MDLLQRILVGLVDFLRSYVDWWGRAVAALSEEFGLDMPVEISNLVGLFVGGFVLYAFLRRLGKWDRKGNQPQSFPLKTAETPNQVVSKDIDKLLGLLFKVVVFILLLVVVATSR